jgi:hypothetical protein
MSTHLQMIGFMLTSTHLSKAGLMFNAQIHKLDKNEKSGNLGGPIAGLQLCFLMGYYTGSTSPREYTVSRSWKNDENRKIGLQKFVKSAKMDKNAPKRVKTPPANTAL